MQRGMLMRLRVSDGVVLWTRTIDGERAENARGVGINERGTIVASGTMTAVGAHAAGDGFNSPLFTRPPGLDAPASEVRFAIPANETVYHPFGGYMVSFDLFTAEPSWMLGIVSSREEGSSVMEARCAVDNAFGAHAGASAYFAANAAALVDVFRAVSKVYAEEDATEPAEHLGTFDRSEQAGFPRGSGAGSVYGRVNIADGSIQGMWGGGLGMFWGMSVRGGGQVALGGLGFGAAVELGGASMPMPAAASAGLVALVDIGGVAGLPPAPIPMGHNSDSVTFRLVAPEYLGRSASSLTDDRSWAVQVVAEGLDGSSSRIFGDVFTVPMRSGAQVPGGTEVLRLRRLHAGVSYSVRVAISGSEGVGTWSRISDAQLTDEAKLPQPLSPPTLVPHSISNTVINMAVTLPPMSASGDGGAPLEKLRMRVLRSYSECRHEELSNLTVVVDLANTAASQEVIFDEVVGGSAVAPTGILPGATGAIIVESRSGGDVLPHGAIVDVARRELHLRMLGLTPSTTFRFTAAVKTEVGWSAESEASEILETFAVDSAVVVDPTLALAGGATAAAADAACGADSALPCATIGGALLNHPYSGQRFVVRDGTYSESYMQFRAPFQQLVADDGATVTVDCGGSPCFAPMYGDGIAEASLDDDSSGDGDDIDSSFTPVQIVGVTFRGGSSDQAGVGGAMTIRRAMANSDSDPDVAMLVGDCTFAAHENTALVGSSSSFAGGGAIVVEDAAATVHFRRVTFSDNVAAAIGGAVLVTRGSINFQDCSLVQNRAGGQGGAVAAVERSTCLFDVSDSVDSLAVGTHRSVGSTATVSVAGIEQGQAVGFPASHPDDIPTGAPYAASPSKLEENNADSGGAILVRDSLLSLSRSVVRNNAAQLSGGAILADRATLWVSNSTISSNLVEDSLDVGDRSRGGALVTLSSTVSIESSGIIGNTAGDGGAVFALFSSLDFEESALIANHARSGSGGALSLTYQSSGTLSKVVAQGNTASLSGGALHCDGCAGLHLSTSWVIDNTASTGAGVSAADVASNGLTGTSQGSSVSAADVTCEHSSITRNLAHGTVGGGGFFLLRTSSDLSTCELQKNYAVRGGGGGVLWEGADEPILSPELATAVDSPSPISCARSALTGGSTHGSGAAQHRSEHVDLVTLPRIDEAQTAHVRALQQFIARASTDNVARYGPDVATTPFALLVEPGSADSVEQDGNALFTSAVAVSLTDKYGCITTSVSSGNRVISATAEEPLIGGVTVSVENGTALFGIGLRAPPGGPYVVQFSAPAGLFDTSTGAAAAAASSGGDDPDEGQRGYATGELTASMSARIRNCVAGEYLSGASAGYACMQCAPGTFSSTTNAEECTRCPALTQAPAGSTSCESCKVGEVQPPGTRSCVRCPVGSFSTNIEDTRCEVCPEGAYCPGGAVVSVVKGFWRGSYDALASGDEDEDVPYTRLLKCPNPNACTGVTVTASVDVGEVEDVSHANSTVIVNGTCAEGYRGVLCGACDDGYASIGEGECEQCPSYTSRVITLAVVSVVGVAAVVSFIAFTMRTAGNPDTKASIVMKIGITHLQVVSLALAFDLEWPATVRNLLVVTNSVVSVDERFVALDCSFSYDTPRIFQRFAVVVALPVFCIAASALLWSIVLVYRRCSTGLPWLSSSSGLRSRFIVSVLVLLFLSHPIVTRAALVLFRCQDVAGVAYMDAALDVPCYSVEHFMWMLGGGIPALLFYSIGVPAMSFLVLRANRHALHLPQLRERLGFAYVGFRPSRYWYESVIMLRKVAIIAVAVFLAAAGPHLQTLAGVIVILVSLGLHNKFQPFGKGGVLHRLEQGSLFTAFITLYCGLLLFSGAGEATGWRMFLTFIIVSVNATFMVVWALTLFTQARSKLARHPVIRRAATLVTANSFVSSLLRDGPRRGGGSSDSDDGVMASIAELDGRRQPQGPRSGRRGGRGRGRGAPSQWTQNPAATAGARGAGGQVRRGRGDRRQRPSGRAQRGPAHPVVDRGGKIDARVPSRIELTNRGSPNPKRSPSPKRTDSPSRAAAAVAAAHARAAGGLSPIPPPAAPEGQLYLRRRTSSTGSKNRSTSTGSAPGTPPALDRTPSLGV